MEENIVLKDQISIEEALKMVEEVKEVQAIENNNLDDKYAIQNEIDVMYHLDRIREAEEAKNDKKKLKDIRIQKLQQQIDEANEWYEKECAEFNRTIELSEFRLTHYYKEQKEKNPKYKLSTPAGSVSLRKTRKPYWNDEEAILNYLRENNQDLIKIKEEIDKTAFKKIYPEGINSETGEIIPGYETKIVESFSIKTK